MLSDSIAFYLLKNEYIEENELPIYKYGLSGFLNSLFQTLIIMLLGILTDSVMETIVFLLVLSSVRRFLGGYHAKTKARCMIMDISMWWGTTYTCEIYSKYNMCAITFIICIFSLYVTCRYAPVENIHKLLSEYQRKHNGRKGRTLVCIFLAIAVIVMKSSIEIAGTILTTLILVDIFVLVDRRENVKRKNMQIFEENRRGNSKKNSK